MSNYPRFRQTEIVVQRLEAELLIYDLNINKAFCLNETLATIYELCDGKNSVAEIVEKSSLNLKSPVPEDLIWLALDQLKRNNLLENADEFAVNFGGLNRRQVVRKVGLASLIALPLIASVVAPSALTAQSGALLSLLAVCTTSPQCASGSCMMAGTFNRCCDPAASSPNLGFTLQQVGCVTTNDCSALASMCCSNIAIAQATGPPVCPPGFPFQCRCGLP
jgi:hypothetical protein